MASVVLERPYPPELEERVEAFESEWSRAGIANPADFLPPSSHPSFRPILCELVRVDLELHWTCGKPKRIEDYVRDFPQLREDRDLLQEIAFEEYRQRLQTGEPVHRAEYAERFDVDVDAWPSARAPAVNGPGSADSDPTMNVPHKELQELALPAEQHFELARNIRFEARHRELPRKWRLPKPEETFEGFQIVEEIGRGSFGRVFKARQLDLANREVALKISLKPNEEPQQLAQLQHTNIMPIYSMHRVGTLQAVCMPLLGSTTLSDLIRGLKKANSLPTSGRMLLSTLFERGRTRRTSQSDPSVVPSMLGSDASASLDSGKFRAVSTAGKTAGRPITHLEQLANMSLVEASLSLMARVADGLAHAHARGILHRDLKPANILITDDGEPMLLDFNLALNVRQAPKSRARMGGTLPYMAPEQLIAFRKGERINDVRCDLYAIGVMLYELMTGTFPYKVHKGKVSDVADVMAKDRLAAVPDARRINRAISPATAAIVKRLMAPHPAQRYQSATELKEDLERQLSHRPLKFASEPSLRERLSKFRRRHPRLHTATWVAICTLLLIVLPVGMVANERAKTERRRQQIVHAESLALAQRTTKDAREAQIYLQSRHQSSALRAQGVNLVEQVLARYGFSDDGQWLQRPELQQLSANERKSLLESMGYTFLAMADTSRMAGRSNNSKIADHSPDYWTRLADQCFRNLGKPRSVKPLSAQTEFSKADLSQWDNCDLYAEASELFARGEYRQALKWLSELLRRDPQHYMGWYLNALSHESLGRDPEADSDWTVCIALQPDFEREWSYFNRGSHRLKMGKFGEAKSDLDEAVKLNPGFTYALINRSQALRQLGRLADSEIDLTTALTHNDPPTRAWFMRARIRDLLGKKAEAAVDRAEGLKREPADDLSWFFRGWTKTQTDPQGALEDFEQALRLNSRCRDALQQRAYVYSEVLHKDKEALAALDDLIKCYPDYVPGRAGRGVCLARLGKGKEAKEDADFCLGMDRSSFCCYQIGSLYAQLVPHDPDAKKIALELLHEALRKGFDQPALFDADSDLDPIRNDPEFKQLAQTAGRLMFLPKRQETGK
ncbi:MAG TPA: serine/threonine-protein kinase [Gemmataceae bacterium]|jgi:serine/threonine protein kinase/lipoprotein NlpI|nr:serine/threonine-protein kinase [Gemmataceae bacterium]